MNCVINPNASCYILCSLWFTIDQARKAIRELGNVWRLELALRPYGEPIWAHDPLDALLHLALLIRNRTTFKCLIGFRSIPTICQIPPSTLFTIHLFFTARCLIIWLSEHHFFSCRLVLSNHSSVTGEQWHLIISQFAENLWYYNMPSFCSDPCILFEEFELLPKGVQVNIFYDSSIITLVTYTHIAKFMGPTSGLPGSCRPHMGPMLAPWTLLSG